jgi:hypothetical protein
MAAPAVVAVPVAVEAVLVAAVELHPPWWGLAAHGRPLPRLPLPRRPHRPCPTSCPCSAPSAAATSTPTAASPWLRPAPASTSCATSAWWRGRACRGLAPVWPAGPAASRRSRRTGADRPRECWWCWWPSYRRNTCTFGGVRAGCGYTVRVGCSRAVVSTPPTCTLAGVHAHTPACVPAPAFERVPRCLLLLCGRYQRPCACMCTF